MAKRAVCIGINDYPGTYNDLGGCVNDANDWADLLKNEFGFGKDVQIITDSAATKDKIVKALEDLVTSSKSGDIAVFTYSGHGTWVYDQGEFDESDNRDEAICAYDGIILDDEIREVIRKMESGVRLTVISDSCHSGGVT
ncbi:MAG: caspase family protein, partial [Phycisphaerales bacterium]